MRVDLGVLRSGLGYFVVKTYISVILFGCNYLYRIYSVFKKGFRCFIVVKKDKDEKDANSEIYA